MKRDTPSQRTQWFVALVVVALGLGLVLILSRWPTVMLGIVIVAGLFMLVYGTKLLIFWRTK